MEVSIDTLYGCWKKRRVWIILWALAWLLCGTIQVTRGDCLHNNHSYNDHSVWQPDPCTVCTCQDPVPLCEPIVCTPPTCNYTHGEKLELPPGQCCPVCVHEKKPCDFRGQLVQHRREWNASSCQTCQCLDGHVVCGNTPCPSMPCKPGEVSQTLPGQCCPICLPLGRVCILEDGTRRVDGSEWSPLPCVKCVCRDGHTRCMSEDCPPVSCPGNAKPSFQNGQCCPVCDGDMCQQGDEVFKDGDVWNNDVCTTCTCRQGQVTCQRVECVDTLDCPRGQVVQTLEGQCCHQCVRNRGKCRMEGYGDRYHGEMWRVEPCEFCTCQRGVVSCQIAQCQPIVCKQGKEKMTLPDECCPRCVMKKTCTVKGQTYQNGQSWDPDSCSSCECREGSVICYRKRCPSTCGHRGSDVSTTKGPCCQHCDSPALPNDQSFPQCNGLCSACAPGNSNLCTSCKDKDKLVQNGRCVDTCRSGYYPESDNVCKECHKTCESCYAGAEYHCLSCGQDKLMKGGQCVPHCGDGHFARDNTCVACHSSCRACRGDRRDQCLECPLPGQAVLSGTCVDHCGDGYFLQGHHCARCPSTCLTCLPDGTKCASCSRGLYLTNGQCRVDCPKGHYADDGDRCQACHPSCQDCRGPSQTECVSCVHGPPLEGGMCAGRGNCTDGQYLSEDLNCLDCYSGCRLCHPNVARGGTTCSMCQDANQVPFGSRCYRNCPLGSVLRNGVCISCEPKCRKCDQTGVCLRCFNPFLLSKGGHCVMDCGNGKYKDNGRCLDCAMDCLQCVDRTTCRSCDATTLLKKGRCVTRCGQRYIARHEMRVCEENVFPPEIKLIGPIAVAKGNAADVTESVIVVTDVDTPQDYLSVVIETSRQTGHIVKVDSVGNKRLSQGDSFMLGDLKQGRIRYMQAMGIQAVSDSVWLKAFDGKLYSQVLEVPITPRSRGGLELVNNKPLVVEAGSDVTLTEKMIAVKVSGEGSEERLVFSVVNGPNYGSFMDKKLSTPVSSFTVNDLRTGTVVYSHHGNQTHTMDIARILVDDGFNQIFLVLEIKVIAKDSLLPVILINTGCQVYVGGMVQITNAMLKTETRGQMNAAAYEAVYTLTPSEGNPRHGQVLMVVSTPESGPNEGWDEVGGGKMAARMARFTQRDIEDGRIYYRHTGTEASVDDEMGFEVSDTANPPNILRDQAFQIIILSSDTSPLSMPTLAPGVKLGMTVFENQIVPITSNHMTFHDDDTPSTDLVYKITSLLAPDQGSVEHIDQPFRRVLQFTQDDINNNRIVYRPPMDEVGGDPIDVSFSFIVTDGKPAQDPKQHQFTIHVIPVNNIPPHFTRPLLNVSVLEKGRVQMSSAMLEVVDADTPLEQLELRLTVAPMSGVMERRVQEAKAVLRKGDSFAVGDVHNGEIAYQHTGGVHPPTDTIVFSVSDGEHQANLTINISVLKIDMSPPQMSSTASCQLNVTEGALVTITRNEMVFSDSDDEDESINIVLAKETTHGYFVKDGIRVRKGEGFSQEDINLGSVKFQVEQEIGTKPITELVYVNASDSSGNVLPNQILSVAIQPIDNVAPVVTFGPAPGVDEGGQVMLSSNSLKTMDIDSPVTRLTLVVKKPPTFGIIRNRRPDKGSERLRNSTARSFPVTDLIDGNLVYVNTDHKDKESTADAFLFHVTDGNNRSPVHRFNVTIRLINDEKPSIITEQLFVEEGQAVTLTNASMFVVDLDSLPEELQFTVESMPRNGILLKKGLPMYTLDKSVILKDKATFTYEDVLQELIVYQHDDGETTQDSIRLRLTDGDFTDSKTISIVVGVVNDETPRVTINRGLRVKAGSKTPLTSRDLKATDLDSEDKNIQYTIVQDPSAGTLQFDNQLVKYILTSSTAARSFKQRDIDNGHILYSHTVGETAGNILFKFKLSDPEGNELIDQDFFITVLEDRLLPVEVTNKEFDVTEGQAVKLTTDFLSYTDHDSEPGSLMYAVLDGPQLGHLELTGQPGVPIVTFTQADLAASAVLYVHTTTEEDHLDKFIFSVTDGRNEVMSSFYIRISPIDDAIPSLVNKGLRVQEGVRKLITEFNLKAVDKDTKEQLITFTVIDPPSHGSLDLITQDGRHDPVTSFSMWDVYENRVSYQHDGSETVFDTFSFVVDDGTNKAFTMQQDQPAPGSPISTPQDFEITVLPMDDGMPVLEVNLGLQYLEPMDGQVGSVISSRELMTFDEDTTPDEIVYTVTTIPALGVLESSARPGEMLTSFTQDDVDRGLVSYKLTNKTGEFQDMFVFDVGDSRPNTVPGNEFHIMWSTISLTRASFNVSEEDGVIQVPIVRKGNLKQYSIVKCVTSAGTAESKQRRGKATSQDFAPMDGQVQFDEWQNEKTCNILINDDTFFEGDETFFVHLKSPSYAVLGDIVKASVTIHDKEDEPTFHFSQEVLQVNETDGIVRAVVVRSGDLTRSLSVVCSTHSITATGSSLKRLESGSDFVSRGTTNKYRVIFPAGVAEAFCDVKLVDDSEFESMEQFEMRLSRPSLPATLGAVDKLIVVIEGPNDESFIYLSEDEYAFPENSGSIDLAVTREGSDLSHTSRVWCATRLSPTPSARPGQDYIPASSQITFGPGQTVQYCPLTLLDDEFQPRLEGNETFHVFLSSAIGSNLKQPIQATVVIYDDFLDLPRMNFARDDYTIDENNKTVNVSIVRQGDITLASSVICYTRQQSAEVAVDYVERPFTNESRVYFKPGEKVKACRVDIMDDTSYEKDEVFLLKLGLPQGSNNTDASLGDLDTAVITITDQDDVPRILFEEASYSIHEPSVMDQVGVVVMTVMRLGALNGSAWIRCSTRDGSAVSGIDYNAKSVVLRFEPGQHKLEFAVDVLYNSALEWHESFSVQLGPEVSVGTQIGTQSVATVTILDNEVSGSLVLPAPPVVVSLLHYDDTETGMKIQPSPGYPLVCISPCDPQHPTYSTTYSLCEESHINQTAMTYSWEVAMPPIDDGGDDDDDDGVDDISPSFVTITDQTLFTFTDRKVLDSVYFRSFFRVRCVAQPLHENGNPGVPIKSLPVTIGHTNPICKAPSIPSAGDPYNTFQAQSFLARLEYTGPGDDTPHPNTLHISVQIPHQDGMLPLVSTHPLHNLRLLLSTPLYRQQHICSNIVFKDELMPMLGRAFLESEEEEDDVRLGSRGPGKDFPHQFDGGLRSMETLRLYRHLNLKSCKWQFDAWYHMTELVDLCGGRVLSDFQVKEKSLTHLTVRVPLYVSYVFVTAPRGWSSMEHHSDMEFSFYYSTVLWSNGMETEERQEGRLQVVRILIGDDGKLVIEFRTQAKFRGLFVMSHHSLPDVSSLVTAPESLTISFDLDLVWSQATFDGPLQMWRAKSKYNLKDYTGVYQVDLIPCLVSPTQSFIDTHPIPCAARQPERFEIPISFQQTNRPVPVLYSLSTEFQLGNSLDMFVSKPGTQVGREADWDFNGAFSKGERLYGRVLWHQDQDLKDGYRLALDKVFLCTGRDGFVPTFDPTGEVYGEGPQYGCLQPSTDLLYRFLILDAESPEDQATQFHQVPFNAVLATHDPRYKAIGDMPGVDGFVMDVDPLYKVNAGHQWYLQVVYTIGVSDTSKYRHRRSITPSSSSSPPSLSSSSSSYSLMYKHQMQQHPHNSKQKTFDQSVHRQERSEQTAISLQQSRNGMRHIRDKTNRGRRDTNSSLSYSNTSQGTQNGTTMQLIHLVFETGTRSSASPASIVASPSFYLPILIVSVLLVCVAFVCIRKRTKRKHSQQEYPPSFINNFVATKNNPHGVARVKSHTSKGAKVDDGDGGKHSTSSVRKSNLCKVKDTNINKDVKHGGGGTEV